ncbi:hypothetical protein E4U19_001924 [Claviceps sp. Clav32 group G5]|nr:hypothetical protein E4U19_001924 [Claviceps sp. Clav32 group G5]KAG6045587.1 hypothetical protein E4U39_002163 [Claviceps sp. Clav50 group G5]
MWQAQYGNFSGGSTGFPSLFNMYYADPAQAVKRDDKGSMGVSSADNTGLQKSVGWQENAKAEKMVLLLHTEELHETNVEPAHASAWIFRALFRASSLLGPSTAYK